MFRKILTVFTVLAALAVAGCASRGAVSDSDEMIQHHVSFEGI